MNGLWQGLMAAAEPINLFFTLCGSALGVLVGSLPGFSSPMAIIVLLPLTYNMDPLSALLMMIGVYVGTKLGGSFSAIMLRTPGTPAAACTTLDGYPMAQSGEAARALGLSTMGSTCGGLFGWAIAFVAVPLVALIAVNSTNADIALIGLAGLMMVSAFVRGSSIKALISVVIGLLLGTVGLDPLTATPRFTFGSLSLMEGIPFAAALIGFFGVCVVLSDLYMLNSSTDLVTRKFAMAMPSFREILHRWQSIGIGSLFGIGVGAIPGVGAEGASWLAYATVRNRSREKARFGKGHPDGILAPEACNNAVTGGTMVPMLTLGIPGDGSTAVMLGALILHGVQPGVFLMRDNPELGYGILAGLLFATIFSFAVGWSAIRAFVYVLTKDRSWLFPFVLVIASIGAFASTNTVFPIYVAIAVGILGFVMERFGFPVVPAVLGLILGPIIEYNARIALSISGGDWAVFVGAPHRVVVLAIVVLMLVWEIREVFKAS